MSTETFRDLWWEHGDIERSLGEYCMTVHLFGAASSLKCTNFALKMTADDFEEEFGNNAAKFVCHNFYLLSICNISGTSHRPYRKHQDPLQERGLQLAQIYLKPKRVNISRSSRTTHQRNKRTGYDQGSLTHQINLGNSVVCGV